MGHVDPLKEVNAAEARIRNNISTQEQEASEFNGNDWNTIMRQRRREIEEAQKLGVLPDAGSQKDQKAEAPDGDNDEEEEENR